MKITNWLAVLSVSVMTGCGILPSVIEMDDSVVKLLPEPVARNYLDNYSDSKDAASAQLHACRFTGTSLNDMPYEKVKFRVYDRTSNVMTKFGGYKYTLETNIGCVLAANDWDALNRLISAMTSLGAKNPPGIGYL
ncbi:hypothetical protein IB286_01935 [Spongiibacter sp. KMU-158]|uniref:Lipoprotein n=1 Tax=Spongiibacter pelagi TaxID=2760804 RepID=A0A927GVU7_9GAMM|nr:hypothetical protein [Spongiibacter pelagi]MBD2857749.1 hypothetical protein [Spongiibacter pelagi]